MRRSGHPAPLGTVYVRSKASFRALDGTGTRHRMGLTPRLAANAGKVNSSHFGPPRRGSKRGGKTRAAPRGGRNPLEKTTTPSDSLLFLRWTLSANRLAKAQKRTGTPRR